MIHVVDVFGAAARDDAADDAHARDNGRVLDLSRILALRDDRAVRWHAAILGSCGRKIALWSAASSSFA